MNDVTSIVVIVALLGLLFLLAVAESALNGMTLSRAEALAEEEMRGASRLVTGLEDRDLLLAPILALALAAQLSVGALVALVVSRRFGNGWIPVGLLVVLLVMFVITESVPKSWARGNIDQAAIASASASRAILRIAPLRWLIRALDDTAGFALSRTQRAAPAVSSEEEIVALAEAAVAADVLEEDEGEIIHSLLDFGDALVREVMIPRPDVLAVGHNTTIDDAIEKMVDRGVSRMPIFGDDVDDVQGVVHIKDLFARVQRGRGDHFVSIALRAPTFVPESKRAAELLRELKGVPTSMVVVIDEHGAMAGIVTMEDLIEEFIGEIVDAFDSDESPLYEPLRPGEWRVLGRIPVDEFNEVVGADLPDDDWDTLGGLILDGLGHVPDVGEVHRTTDLNLVVEAVEGRRITRVRVEQRRARDLNIDEPDAQQGSQGLLSNG